MREKDTELIQELRATLSKMELSLGAIDDCIIWIDDEGVIQWCNEKLSTLLGRTNIEILGQPIQNLVHLKISNQPINWTELIHNATSRNRSLFYKFEEGANIKYLEVLIRNFQQVDQEKKFIIVLHDATDNYFNQARLKDANEDLQYVNEELAKSAYLKSKLAAIIEFTDDAIIGETLEGKIESWNNGAELLYGYKAEEVIGQSTNFLYPPNKKAEFTDALEQLKTGKNLKIFDTERLHKNGFIVPVSVIMSPIRNRGLVVGFCSIARDITELKEMMNLKNEFISTVSHELRTPLTSIQGSFDLLVDGVAGELPEDAQELLKIGKTNTERLIRLINDILDIQKIESGKMEFHPEPTNIGDLIRESLLTNQGYADQFNVKIKFVQKGNGIVNVDRDKILQVLANLISNAAKFSTGDEIKVFLYKLEDTVRVEVTNQGAGIPKEFESRIFQKFSQAKGATNKVMRGTGLGLSISKEIIEKHHGIIGFKSEENKQTTFYFELPIYKNLELEESINYAQPF